MERLILENQLAIMRAALYALEDSDYDRDKALIVDLRLQIITTEACIKNMA